MKLGRVCWWQECVEDGYLMDVYLYPNLRLTSTKGPSDLHMVKVSMGGILQIAPQGFHDESCIR